jgi:hypothetical protein
MQPSPPPQPKPDPLLLASLRGWERLIADYELWKKEQPCPR